MGFVRENQKCEEIRYCKGALLSFLKELVRGKLKVRYYFLVAFFGSFFRDREEGEERDVRGR